MSSTTKLTATTTTGGNSALKSTAVNPQPGGLAAALLAHQLPQLPKFSGEDLDNEPFQDWVTQFEMVANLCELNATAKLVHLTTRLLGQAFAFYQTCSGEQKSNYDQLVAELTKRFTPVRIQAVQTSKFHERKQKTAESVDSFAQDLRKLFYKAYPATTRGSKEMEEMGQSVLSSQFVAGLLPELKSKI